MSISPIALFVYNRQDHLDILIRSLKKNNLFAQTKVLVFSDGPRNEIDKNKIVKIRKYLKQELIPCNTEFVERTTNLGLSKNVISGITQTFKTYNQAIILEDDLEVSPFFLNYMNDALDLYADTKNVASVSGYMYPINSKKFSNNYFFLKLIESWGWGTWKRAWSHFEVDAAKLKKLIDKKKLIDEFNLGSGISYYKMLINNIIGKNDSWAVRWYASTFLKDMNTLFPSTSFVKNIGMDGSGENCDYTSVYNNLIQDKYEKLEKIDNIELASDRLAVRSFFQKIKYKRYLDNIFNKIKKFIK